MKVYTITHRLRYKSKILYLLFSLAICLGCRKDNAVDLKEEVVVSPTTGTRTEFTLDSIFLYAKQIYLWNDVLPTYNSFAARDKYNSIKPEFSAFQKELFDISQLKLHQETGQPYEISKYNNVPKYSYLQAGRTIGGTVQAGIGTGEAILINDVIHSENKIIAYVALGSFPPLSSSKSKLDQIFGELAVEKPKYLIIDLRFNRGGYVETAEYIANLIAPSTLNGKVMYVEQFNSTLQTGKATILSHQPYFDQQGKTVNYNGRIATMADVDYRENSNTYRFEKKGGLETIQDVYFIVSVRTASASELLISCLKPYFNIKLVGEKTYGKPVGFFGINIDQYTVYLSSFLIKNALGWADYLTGMEPDIPVVGSANPILGDSEELCLKAAVSAINGNIKLTAKKVIYTSKEISLASPLLIPGQLQTDVGIIENRLKLKN